MKRMLLLFTMIVYTLLFVGCDSSKQNPIIYKETNTTKEEFEESIKYEVEQVTLSKGYQNMAPNVEIIKKGSEFKLLASLGLIESSGVNITEINKNDNEINIYVENKNKLGKSDLVVPQVLIDLKGIKVKNKDDLKFNIINENYDPIKIKLGINEVINKINADFQLSMNTLPIVNILNDNDKVLWELTYNNIFDKFNVETPIINLSVLIDANNGDIVKSSKNFISSFIDEGYILDYVPNKSILYKKTEGNAEENNLKDSLWMFNTEDNSIEVLYPSKTKIESASSNSNGNHIALIESHKEHNELYIIDTKDKKAYKVFLKENLNPYLIQWASDEELYVISKDEKVSNIFKYNITENITTLIASIHKNIVDLQVMGDSFLITEGNESNEKSKIYLTKNWSQNRFDDYGFKPMALDENKIAYLQFNKKDNSNSLRIYDINKSRNYSTIKRNIIQYFLLDDENIGLIEKNNVNNEYTFHKYNIKDKTIDSIANINSERVLYDSERELLYTCISVPFESELSQIIYSIDLSKISN